MVHSKFQDLVPKHIELDDPELQRPDEDKIKEVIHRVLRIYFLSFLKVAFSVTKANTGVTLQFQHSTLSKFLNNFTYLL